MVTVILMHCKSAPKQKNKKVFLNYKFAGQKSWWCFHFHLCYKHHSQKKLQLHMTYKSKKPTMFYILLFPFQLESKLEKETVISPHFKRMKSTSKNEGTSDRSILDILISQLCKFTSSAILTPTTRPGVVVIYS